MPYADPEKRRAASNARSRKYRARKHAERFGPNAGDMRGRHGNHPKRDRNPRWNPSARRVTSHGYVAVRVPIDHPHGWGPKSLKRFRYAYEHVVVMMRITGRPLRPGETVHHKNGDRTDNRPENLELLTRSEHALEHAEAAERDRLGRFVPDTPRIREAA